jgi:hypothetical protein
MLSTVRDNISNFSKTCFISLLSLLVQFRLGVISQGWEHTAYGYRPHELHIRTQSHWSSRSHRLVGHCHSELFAGGMLDKPAFDEPILF